MDSMRYLASGLKFLLSGIGEEVGRGGGVDYEHSRPMTVIQDTLVAQRTIVNIGGGEKQYNPYTSDVVNAQLMRPWWDKLK